MLSVTGRVYDTLEEVVGLRGRGKGSLMDFGISCSEVDLKQGKVNFDGIADKMNDRTKVIFIQKSFGYSWRQPVYNDDVARIVRLVKRLKSDVVVVVDNCFSELCEDTEATDEHIGADLAAGSLIKGIGGGITPNGGYIVGRKHLVEKAKCRLYAPGVETGASLGLTKTMAQGLFMAPCNIAQSLKSSALIAETMWQLGYDTLPSRSQNSCVRAVKLGSAARPQAFCQAFCQAVQRSGAIDSWTQAVPGTSARYGDAETFAQSTFVDGATAKLSADRPMRPPWAVFAQGALCWQHWALALVHVVRAVGCAPP